MTVYLISLPNGRREPYFELAAEQMVMKGSETRDWLTRTRARVVARLHDLERRAHEARTAVPPRRWTGRLERRVVAWLASRIVEQRLLWYLRSEAAVTLRHATSDPAGDALRAMRGELARDRMRHLRGALLHGTLLLLSAPVAFMPGPNVPGYIFTFTAVGHALAALGAQHGLRRVHWQPVADPALTALADALRADAQPGARDAAVARLPLTRLSLFLDRVAPPTA